MSSLKLRNLGVLHQGHLYKATSPFLLMTEFFFFFFSGLWEKMMIVLKALFRH